MKVCAVIVTYGDRFKFLKQVIDASIREGINKIIVVDNASAENSRNALKEYEKKLKNKLKVIYLDKNTGSAGGYKRGLEEAYKCEDCEYIWLLDDDNMPQKDSLKVLKDFWNNFSLKNKEENLCLLSFRPDRQIYKEAIITHNPDLVLGRKNSFLGFHIIDLPKKMIRSIKRKLNLPLYKDSSNIQFGKVSVAPYGGMFFHKNLLNKIGYPKEEFFVYADDHEWSYRITKNGGNIYLILDSLLKDIDISWHLKSKSKSSFYSYLNEGSKFRVYYSIRNRIFFEQEMKTNNFMYKLNMKLFFIILNFYKNRVNIDKYEVFVKAVNNGLNYNLGSENENIVI